MRCQAGVAVHAASQAVLSRHREGVGDEHPQRVCHGSLLGEPVTDRAGGRRDAGRVVVGAWPGIAPGAFVGGVRVAGSVAVDVHREHPPGVRVAVAERRDVRLSLGTGTAEATSLHGEGEVGGAREASTGVRAAAFQLPALDVAGLDLGPDRGLSFRCLNSLRRGGCRCRIADGLLGAFGRAAECCPSGHDRDHHSSGNRGAQGGPTAACRTDPRVQFCESIGLSAVDVLGAPRESPEVFGVHVRLLSSVTGSRAASSLSFAKAFAHWLLTVPTEQSSRSAVSTSVRSSM